MIYAGVGASPSRDRLRPCTAIQPQRLRAQRAFRGIALFEEPASDVPPGKPRFPRDSAASILLQVSPRSWGCRRIALPGHRPLAAKYSSAQFRI